MASILINNSSFYWMSDLVIMNLPSITHPGGPQRLGRGILTPLARQTAGVSDHSPPDWPQQGVGPPQTFIRLVSLFWSQMSISTPVPSAAFGMTDPHLYLPGVGQRSTPTLTIKAGKRVNEKRPVRRRYMLTWLRKLEDDVWFWISLGRDYDYLSTLGLESGLEIIHGHMFHLDNHLDHEAEQYIALNGVAKEDVMMWR